MNPISMQLLALRPNGVIRSAGGSVQEFTSSGKRRYFKVVCSTDGLKIAAYVQDGYIYTSNDDGANFVQCTSVGAKSWDNLVCSADGLTIVATDTTQNIYISTNGGANFVVRTGLSLLYQNTNNPTVLAISSDSSTIFFEQGGWLYITTDYGVSFVEHRLSSTLDLGACSADGSKIILATYDGHVHTSTNGGASFVERIIGSGPTFGTAWSSLACSADGLTIFASRYGGYIYKSTDGGENFIACESAGIRFWRDISCSADGLRVIALQYGFQYIYTSTDGGSSFVERSEIPNQSFISVACSANGLKAFLVVNDSINRLIL